MLKTPLAIARTDPRDPQATALLGASHTLLQSMFASDDNYFLSVDDLCAPSIHFFMATHAGCALGCAALSDKGDYGEVKSMYVVETARGTGTGEQLLRRLETEAKALNLPVLRLETGTGLDAAHRLYHRHGFIVCGPFGDYKLSDASIFMEKPLQ